MGPAEAAALSGPRTLGRPMEECRQCGVAAAMAAGTTLGQAAVNSGVRLRCALWAPQRIAPLPPHPPPPPPPVFVSFFDRRSKRTPTGWRVFVIIINFEKGVLSKRTLQVVLRFLAFEVVLEGNQRGASTHFGV